MDSININHPQILSLTSSNSNTPIASSIAEAIAIPQKAPDVPSAIVNLSEEGLTLSVLESLENKIEFVEKSDDEYKTMSFEALINERDGQGKFRAEGDTTLYVMNAYGKAAQEAFNRIRAQQVENSQNAKNLGEALNQFKAKVTEGHPDINASDIDVTFKDGELAIVDSKLTGSQKAQVQNLLDSSLAEAKALKRAIVQFNEGGLTMINMMIYDEVGHYAGENSEGKAVVHRDEMVSMKEFLQDAHYSNVASSGGNYTWNKFHDLVGSTKWGARLVLED